MDYVTGLVSYGIDKPVRRPVCAVLTSSLGWLGMVRCDENINQEPRDSFICQYPDARLDRSVQPPAPPSLAKINLATSGQDTERWAPVICPSGHVTHTFLACDVATFCLAEGKLTTSLRPEAWALPTSHSCSEYLTSLPPYFLCRSEQQHVPYTLVCDHQPHCLDGSDETFCKYLPCQWEFQFQCLSEQVCVER